jgi:hypothetical protein
MLHSTRLGSAAVALLLGYGQFGCASRPTLRAMDPSLPIETDRGYRQRGEPLDPKDMTDKLSEEPAAGSLVRRSRALAIVTQVLATVGGGLIGWPLGTHLRGGDPNWTLAYAGAGAIVVSIPIAVWSADSMNDAIDAHNRALVVPAPSPSAPPAPAQPPPPRHLSLRPHGSEGFPSSQTGICWTW